MSDKLPSAGRYNPFIGEDLHVVDIGFSQQLAFEIALDWKPASEVFEDHGVSPEEARRLLANKRFADQVARFHKELQESGDLFKLRAGIAAGRVIEVVYRIAHGADVTASTRLEAAKTLARWGGYDDSSSGKHAVGPGINLTINIPQVTGGHEVVDVTAERVPAAVGGGDEG